jgi:GDP-L-fucose synthase
LKNNKKTILLTGGSGFIGKNIKESFLSEKYNLISPTSKELNVTDQDSVDACFFDNQIDIVIHSACKPGHRNAKDTSDLFLTNAKMFFNLEKHKHEYEKMLVIGSGAIYDMRHCAPKMKEEYYGTFMPTDEHGFCKYVCEHTIKQSDNIFDLRVFSIFGKYEDYAIRFISNAICKSIFDLPITIKQNRFFDFIYVNDLMPVLAWFIDNNPAHKAYNITPDNAITLLEVAKIVRQIAQKPSLPIQVASEGMALEYSGDNSRLKSECGIAFTPLHQAIQELYAWYYNNKSMIYRKLLLFDK